MTVQPSQGHEPGDTPPEELDRLIGAAAEAAPELVGSRPSDRAGWLEHLATRLDVAADDLVPVAAQETHLGVNRLQGELKCTTFQLRLSAAVNRSWMALAPTLTVCDLLIMIMGRRPNFASPIGFARQTCPAATTKAAAPADRDRLGRTASDGPRSVLRSDNGEDPRHLAGALVVPYWPTPAEC
ncbi:MAG TPA: hypothetical protein VI094_04315 [Propionibacteriaceae bacterium]